MLRFALVAAAVALTACAAPAAGGDAAVSADAQALAEDGRSIAEAECAACHVVGEYGESPNPAAPTFRTVLSRYRAEVLKEELINGIRVAHPMPEFQFNPQSADALIAYLQAIQAPPVAPQP
jgi:mono/diheme cytochrome c family protein